MENIYGKHKKGHAPLLAGITMGLLNQFPIHRIGVGIYPFLYAFFIFKKYIIFTCTFSILLKIMYIRTYMLHPKKKKKNVYKNIDINLMI